MTSRLTKPQLLERIQAFCYNDDEDPLTLEPWQSMTVTQLRSVVGILRDYDAARISHLGLDAVPPQVVPAFYKRHCFLLRVLLDYMEANRSIQPANPRTRSPFTYDMQVMIHQAYWDFMYENWEEREIPLDEKKRLLVTEIYLNNDRLQRLGFQKTSLQKDMDEETKKLAKKWTMPAFRQKHTSRLHQMKKQLSAIRSEISWAEANLRKARSLTL